MPLTGGTVTGPIYLPSDTPTTDTQAVTKKYVDDSVAGAGGGDVTAADINKFNSAYSVAQIKGEQGFGVKDEEGNSVWVMLSKSDFESVLLISSNEQTEAYNTFYALRNKVETAETVKDVIAIVWPNIWPESK